MESILRIMKALGEAHRLQAFLALLRTEELCVCEAAALLELSVATTSRHMSVLSAAGLIASEKRGKWVYYRLAPQTDPLFLQWMEGAISGALPAEDEKERIREKIRCCRKPSGQPK